MIAGDSLDIGFRREIPNLTPISFAGRCTGEFQDSFHFGDGCFVLEGFVTGGDDLFRFSPVDVAAPVGDDSVGGFLDRSGLAAIADDAEFSNGMIVWQGAMDSQGRQLG